MPPKADNINVDKKLESKTGDGLSLEEELANAAPQPPESTQNDALSARISALEADNASLRGKLASNLNNPRAQTPSSTQEFFRQEYTSAKGSTAMEEHMFVLKIIEDALKADSDKKPQDLIKAAKILDGYCHGKSIKPAIWSTVSNYAQENQEFLSLLALHAPEFCNKLNIHCTGSKPLEGIEIATVNEQLQRLVIEQQGLVSDKDRVVEELRKQNQDLISKLSTAKEKIQAAEQQTSELQSQLELQNQDQANATKTLNEQHDQAIKALEAQLESVKSDKSDAESKVLGLETSILEQASLVEQQKSELLAKIEEAGAAKKDAGVLQAQLQELTFSSESAASDLRRQLKQAQEDLGAQKQAQEEAANALNEQHDQAIKALEAQLESVKSDKSDAESKVLGLETSILEQASLVEQQKSELLAKIEEAGAAKKDAGVLQAQLQELTFSSESAASDLRRQLKQAQEDLGAQKQAQEEAANALNEQHDQAIKALEAQLESVKSDKSDAESKVLGLETSILEQASLVEQQKSELLAKIEEAGAAKKDAGVLQAQLQELTFSSESAASDLRRQLKQAQEDLGAQKQAQEEAANALNEQHDQAIKALEAQLESVKSDKSDAESKVLGLETSILEQASLVEQQKSELLAKIEEAGAAKKDAGVLQAQLQDLTSSSESAASDLRQQLKQAQEDLGAQKQAQEEAANALNEQHDQAIKALEAQLESAKSAKSDAESKVLVLETSILEQVSVAKQREADLLARIRLAEEDGQGAQELRKQLSELKSSSDSVAIELRQQLEEAQKDFESERVYYERQVQTLNEQIVRSGSWLTDSSYLSDKDELEDLISPNDGNSRKRKRSSIGEASEYSEDELLSSQYWPDGSDTETLYDSITTRDGKDLGIIEQGLEYSEDGLLKFDDLSIPDVQGNVKDPKVMKQKFPGKAGEIDQLGNLPIKFYDENGIADLHRQINESSSLSWSNGRCTDQRRKGHEALISYTFDGTHYRLIVAQEGRVSVNFVSFEYMLQQSKKLESTKGDVALEIGNGTFDDLPLGAEAGTSYKPAEVGDADQIALNMFYRGKLEEIKEATNVVVANNIDIDKICQKFDRRFGSPELLESLIFSPELAPINLDGRGGYSISRDMKDGKNDIRINCISGEDGKFKDNVMYVNVTGTNHYVKVQVARENGETIDGQTRREGDIVILEGLYKEPKAEGKMLQTEMEALSQVDQDAIANCNIVANAVIRSRELGDKVKISSAVKFQGQIVNQEVKEETKTEVLIDFKAQNKQTEQKKSAAKTPPSTSRSSGEGSSVAL